MRTTDRTWRRAGSRTVFHQRVRLEEHAVTLPDGSPSTYVVDESMPCAVATLIHVPGRGLVLTSQYRFPLDAWILDLPGGACATGERPEQAAVRECREEVRMAPTALVELATFYPNPGRAAWPVHLFFSDGAQNVTEAEGVSDPSEVVERRFVPAASMDDLIRAGGVVDPSLLIAWQRARLEGLL